MTADPGFEAALFRAYNRYIARQCQTSSMAIKSVSPLAAPNTLAG
jgi:hypothetical protein